MSTKGKRRKAGKSRRSAAGRKKASVKINCGGLKIEVPPELDLPAGAPFSTGEEQERAPSIPGDVQALLKPLASIATNAWRARTKMTDAETGEPLEEMRRVYRSVEGIFAALEDAGVRVVDYTGRTYDSGMALKVLGFERTPGLAREEIIETIRPSVIWQERFLQMGEVIVGTPETTEQDNTALDTTAHSQAKATADHDNLSAEAASTPGDCSAEALSGPHGSSGATDGQSPVPPASPAAGGQAAEADDAAGDRQFDRQADAEMTASDAPAAENPSGGAHDAASKKPGGAHDEQDND